MNRIRTAGSTCTVKTVSSRLQLPARRLLPLLLLAGGAIVTVLAPRADAAEPAKTSATPSAPAAAAVTTVPTMTQDALLEHQSKHAGHLVVLDVRTPEEFAAGHVPGAVNVPYDQIGARLAEVPQDKDLVLYCKSGRRAGLAADVLKANGYTRLSHLEGDMNAWLEKGRPIAKP